MIKTTICTIAVLSSIVGAIFLRTFTLPVSAQTESFVFTTGGDHGAPNQTDTRNSLQAIINSGAAFHLALGDMSYGDTNNNAEPIDGTTPSPWCSGTNANQNIKLIVGDTFPFQLVAGNHEDDGNDPVGDGWINNYALCLPDRMGSVGTYGAQYYFNYPQTNPLMRVIMISPDLTVSGTTYNYTSGTDISTPRGWLINAIDSARASGIKWVVVGMHKNCITIGEKTCEIGTSLLTLLVQKKVDLVVQGHDHTYQRSKQLALSSNCSSIPSGTVNAGCIVDSGADATYTKDQGTVIVVSGLFGGGSAYALNCSDGERDYFAKAMGGDGNIWDGSSCALGGVGRGLMKFTVSSTAIGAEFILSQQTMTGSPFSDAFTITEDSNPPSPTPTPMINPTPTETATVGSSLVTATIPADGVYTVWSRMMAPNTTNNSYWLQMDSAAPVLVGNGILPENVWTWVDYQDGAPASRIQVSLTAGIHVVKLMNGEPGVRVEKVYFTPDPSCVPVDTGINCSSVSPSPTPTLTPTLTPTIPVPTVTATVTPSRTPTPTVAPPTITPPPGTPVTLLPIDDTYVRSDAVTGVYGASTALQVDGSPVKIIYVKFDLTPYAGRIISSAKLRLRVTDNSSGNQVVKEVASTTWSESTLNYSTRPAIGSTVKTYSSQKNNSTIEVDILSYISTKAGSLVSFAIDSTSSNGADYVAEESATNKPQLILTLQ